MEPAAPLGQEAQPAGGRGLLGVDRTQRAQIRARLGPRYMEVRYEDLVEQPQPPLKRIGEFIGHDLDYARIQQARVGSVDKPLTAFKEELKAGRFSGGPLEK